MILYPAIDIRGGQAVRLLQGDYERETAYDADPVDAAARWAGEGAEFLHVVDLDGAKAGEPRNLEAVRRIAAAVECPIQVGGGLRDADSVAAVLDAGRGAGRDRHRGAARPGVPRPRRSPSTASASSSRSTPASGKVVALGLDRGARDGDVADAVAELGERGVARFLCTAIEVDGTMEGPAARASWTGSPPRPRPR